MVELVDNLDPNFKSSLPPRKRAKTKEEKEQRRMERILRNRRAAHASREKKRKHVEYLESYVVQLEENLTKLQGNFDSVRQLLTKSQLSGVALQDLSDLSDLKEKIHSNLNSSLQGCDGGDLGENSIEPETKKRKLSSVKVEHDCDDFEESDSATREDELQEEPSPQIEKNDCVSIKREDDSHELLSISNDNIYFNYLSPISINSPINSPIDLTLKKSDEELPPLTLNDSSSFTSPTESTFSSREYDLMEQNSEEILLHRGIDGNNSLVISC